MNLFSEHPQQWTLVDGSRLIVEACIQAGAEVYVGYPITPASLIYSYSSQRFPATLPAPDEITALQWMCGLSASGLLPVTATSFPGFALMLESLNMAYMMELGLLIILVQRLGPATGTATAGAQGDLWLLHGAISGGYTLPVFCISSLEDCWNLPPIAVHTAAHLRTPVVLLTSKEMVMTHSSLDLTTLSQIEPIKREALSPQSSPYTYARGENRIPSSLPIGNPLQQIRLNASTHDEQGILKHTQPEALRNTLQLEEKINRNTPALYELDEQPGATTLLVSYDISSGACREAIVQLRDRGFKVSLLRMQTLLPIPPAYYSIIDTYDRVFFVEENHQGQLAHLIFGQRLPAKMHVLSAIGKMIDPDTITRQVLA